jgi:hypothetical protein
MQEEHRLAHLVAWGGIILVMVIGLIGFRQAANKLHTERPRASAVVGELVASARVGQAFGQVPGPGQVQVMLDADDRRNAGSLIFHLRTAPGPGLFSSITLSDARRPPAAQRRTGAAKGLFHAG